jgi:uncharacterized protein YbaR (Trm112 family)
MLICPRCHSELVWQISRASDDRIDAARITCGECDADYEVREGIGNFLLPGDERRDMWEQIESGLMAHVRKNPDVHRRLMDGPSEELSPADKFFRVMVLEEEGHFGEASELDLVARKQIYTTEYLTCWESEVGYVLENIKESMHPVVDLATGRGNFVERLLRETERIVLATDFSPRVLRSNEARFQALGLSNRLSQVTFDARRTPFRDKSVHTLTTNLGLANIARPGELLKELRRIVSGKFLSITHFYPEGDRRNALAIHEAGLPTFLFRDRAIGEFQEAGWNVAVENRCRSVARPTPMSELLDGAGIDALPIVETELEWCVLVCE